MLRKVNNRQTQPCTVLLLFQEFKWLDRKDPLRGTKRRARKIKKRRKLKSGRNIISTSIAKKLDIFLTLQGWPPHVLA